MFESPLSLNERETLCRFVSKIIEDVDKVAALFESRGTDASSARAAEFNLKRTLEMLEARERREMSLRTHVAGTV